MLIYKRLIKKIYKKDRVSAAYLFFLYICTVGVNQTHAHKDYDGSKQVILWFLFLFLLF